MKKIELLEMKLKVGDVVLELSVEEMRELKRVLLDALPEPYHWYIQPQPYQPLVQPYDPPVWTNTSDKTSCYYNG